MVVEAEFVNPQSSNWICGFLIRNSGVSRAEIFGLTGAQRWVQMTLGAEEYTTLAEGPIQSANFRGANRLLLLVFGDSGWYFVNDDLVAKIDLSHNQDSGWVSAIAHAYLDNQDSPEEFENFTVWAP